MPDEDFPTTDELKVVQLDKLEAERERAEQADAVEDPAAQRAHARRAEKAAYLAEKLDEQGKALGE